MAVPVDDLVKLLLPHARFSQARNLWMIRSKEGYWSPEHSMRVERLLQQSDLCETMRQVDDCKHAAKAALAVRTEAFDRDPWLMGVGNGVLDLRDGRIEPIELDLIPSINPMDDHPAMWLTRYTDTPCDETMPTPLWEAHLLRLLEGDQERVDWLQRALGMALCASDKEKSHTFIVLKGPAGGGKGTLLRALRAALGGGSIGHTATVTGSDLGGGQRHTQWKTSLRGARLAIVGDAVDGYVNPNVIRELAGGDAMRANRMRENDTEWEPTHTLVMAANQAPHFGRSTEGMPRRYRPVRTGAAPSTPAMNYEADLHEELPGILAWLVQGCLLWQAEGKDLRLLESIEADRDEDLGAENWPSAWCVERCVARPGVWTKRSILAVDFLAYLKPLGEGNAYRPQHLYKWLRDEGYRPAKRNGVDGFSGIRLANAREQLAEEAE